MLRTWGLTVYAPQTKLFPGTITYEHLKDFITTDKYKITCTTENTLIEITDLLNNNQLRFQDSDLKVIDDASFKKIRPGKEEKSPLHKQQSKRTINKPWQ